MDERICPLIPEEEKEEKNLQKNTEIKKDDSPSPFRRRCRRSGARIQSQFLKIKNDFDKLNEKEDNEYNEYNYLLHNDIFYRRQKNKYEKIKENEKKVKQYFNIENLRKIIFIYISFTLRISLLTSLLSCFINNKKIYNIINDYSILFYISIIFISLLSILVFIENIKNEIIIKPPYNYILMIFSSLSMFIILYKLIILCSFKIILIVLLSIIIQNLACIFIVFLKKYFDIDVVILMFSPTLIFPFIALLIIRFFVGIINPNILAFLLMFNLSISNSMFFYILFLIEENLEINFKNYSRIHFGLYFIFCASSIITLLFYIFYLLLMSCKKRRKERRKKRGLKIKNNYYIYSFGNP